MNCNVEPVWNSRAECPTSGVHLIRCSQYVLACLSEDVGCFVRASSCPLCTRTAKERLRVLSASTSPLHYSVGGQRDLTRAKMTKQSSLDSFFLRGHALWKRNTAAAARKTQSRENWKRSASATFPLCDIVLLWCLGVDLLQHLIKKWSYFLKLSQARTLLLMQLSLTLTAGNTRF